ncbi:MAG: FAD-dependent monooxygenase [Bdellovibrionaceae bacterium]|nr:FAD-dependent monooxygenase [Pseudobdellovibrionaceae bacterium]
MKESVPSDEKKISLKVLVCGAGIAGPAVAFWLAKSGHKVTVVERFPTLRATGAQIDLRGQGIETVKRMGLLPEVQSKLVDELGVAFVDAKGRVKATIMANTSGKGKQTLTSEYEIMRGDLVKLLFDKTKESVTYLFNKSVDQISQNEEHVDVSFSDGTSDSFDLLIGADGQGSRIRQALFPGIDPYRRMGIHMAYYFIPKEDDDSNIRQTYMAPRGRMIMRRTHSDHETQVYFTLRESSEEASSIHRKPIDEQKHFWAKRFADSGWQITRFLTGMKTTENFYSQEVVQVQLKCWSKGRVVLVGDAAHCASPFSGMGASGSLVGAYVLADEIERSVNDLPNAFQRYEAVMRPFVNEIQNVSPLLLRLGLPQSALAIRIFHLVTQIAHTLKVPELVARFSRERDGKWNSGHS